MHYPKKLLLLAVMGVVCASSVASAQTQYTPQQPAKPHWKAKGCKQSFPSRTSYKVATRILKNYTPYTLSEGAIIHRYIVCVETKAKAKAVRKHVNRLRQWRAQRVCTASKGNVALGRCMARRDYGWTGAQFNCLYALWSRESGWVTQKANYAGSGAYGIPQALPGSKMGPGWQTDPVVQIRWGLNYIAGRYGTPCGADGFQSANNWY